MWAERLTRFTSTDISSYLTSRASRITASARSSFISMMTASWLLCVLRTGRSCSKSNAHRGHCAFGRSRSPSCASPRYSTCALTHMSGPTSRPIPTMIGCLPITRHWQCPVPSWLNSSPRSKTIRLVSGHQASASTRSSKRCSGASVQAATRPASNAHLNRQQQIIVNSKLLICLLGVTLAAINGVQAQSSPANSPETAGVLPRPEFRFPGNVGRTYQDSDPAQFPQPVQAPKGAPNVLLILIDDVGYGQFSTFGGGVPSPTMDKLAAEGLRYNRFHTTALCSPTRAALITGRNHHSTSFGSISEAATGYDGYVCVMPRETGTIGEVLRQNGYMTAWIGKNHNTPTWESSAAGPFDHWVNGLGFDYFYGFNGGDMNQFQPVLYENYNLVPASTNPNYHLTEDLADHAIAWMRNVKSLAPDKPFFLYVAPGATHAPHQAPADWIAKFKGQFDMGWDKYREITLERQKKLGVVPPDTKLTERSPGLQAWDSLNADQKQL